MSFIARLEASDQFNAIDLALVRLLARLDKEAATAVLLAAALVSRVSGEGHVCLPLAQWAGREIDGSSGLYCPAMPEWRSLIKQSPLVGDRDQWRPLILDGPDRLYLQRLHRYEQIVAQHLRQRASAPDMACAHARLRELLLRYFEAGPAGAPNWQQTAGLIAAKRPLCVISGGPGTGKTTTVAKILALWMGLAPDSPPRVALCAPTGKAAARLSEALRQAKENLPLGPSEKIHIPDQAVTIHRILGLGRHGRRRRTSLDFLRRLDALVVDEASMVDLVLMAQLLEALPAHARLLLLGDRDQLSSVEAGAIMGDLCRHAAPEAYSASLKKDLRLLVGQESLPEADAGARVGPLNDSVVILRHSYRFRPEQGVGALTQGVNQGRPEAVKSLLRGHDDDLDWISLPAGPEQLRVLRTKIVEGFGFMLRAPSVAEALARLDTFVVLCALREGPWGVHQMNRWIERQLRQAGCIDGIDDGYQGRPVMITRNDYRLRLFNGDVGIIWNEFGSRHQDAPVFFHTSDGRGLRTFPRQRLPQHQTAFAMTVHKSQGSEFDEVMLVLAEQDAPLFTRELLYTGVSRARRRVTLVAGERVLDVAVKRRLERTSGLSEALWS
jgi:exodeoxyribonuclease V alpha subunit